MCRFERQSGRFEFFLCDVAKTLRDRAFLRLVLLGETLFLCLLMLAEEIRVLSAELLGF
jgi:hypothetical protein